jgi:transcriptional regulator with XRE-family HTH domain
MFTQPQTGHMAIPAQPDPRPARPTDALRDDHSATPAVRQDLGEQIWIYRRRRGMSRRVVANLVGRSEEWLRQVERGQRRLDSIEVLVHLARVLHIEDLSEFLGWRTAPSRPLPTMAKFSHDLRTALLDPVWTYLSCAEPTEGSASTDQLVSGLSLAWERWQSSPSRHDELTAALPGLLRGLRSACRRDTADPGLTTQLGRAYGLARYLADQVNEPHLAWVAAERCLAAVERSTELAERGAAAVHRSACLRTMHYLAEARQFALSCADHMASTETLAIKGELLLQAAEACAAMDHRQEALRLLDQAQAIADQLGGDTAREFVHFGPAEVGLRKIRISLQLGQVDAALHLARTTTPPNEGLISTRTGYLIAMAYAYLRARDDVASVFALNRVATISPGDLRYDTLARTTIQQLNRRGHVLLVDDLAELSRLAGLP